jgi:hypothetical protein
MPSVAHSLADRALGPVLNPLPDEPEGRPKERLCVRF